MGFGSVGVKEFVKLDDTPSAYTGQGGKVAKVNVGEDAVEFGTGGIAGVKVRKNTTMPVIGTRPQLNFIEGVGIQVLAQDNPPDDEIDLAISSMTPEKFIKLLPDGASLPTANPAAKATVDGANFAYDVLDFDPDTEESCNWKQYLSPDYQDENIVIDIFWLCSDADTGHKVLWGIKVLGLEDGEAFDSALGAEETVLTTNKGSGVLHKSRISTFAPDWAKGDVVILKLARKAADGTDTVDTDARVVKVVIRYTTAFAQSFYPLTPQSLDLPSLDSWQDMDVSDYVPVGATGVILHCDKAVGGTTFGLRKRGSTDDRKGILANWGHTWAMVGLDEYRTFQTYISNTNGLHFYLIGYTGTGVIFFNEAIDKTIDVKEVWTDIDLSAECPNALGIIVELKEGISDEYALRGKGFTYDPPAALSLGDNDEKWQIVGCDQSGGNAQIIQGWEGWESGVGIFIVGYITKGATFKTVPPDITPASEAEWLEIDLSIIAPKACMAFVDVAAGYSSTEIGLRKNGSEEDIFEQLNHAGAFVECDQNQKLEGRRTAGKSVEMFLTGYATHAD